MDERISTCQFTTIGDVIKKYREKGSLTISKLADLSGISKGAISKIERGVTERPEFNTITLIAKVIEMPMEELIEHYSEIDKRPEVLFELINEAIQLSSISLLTKVAIRFLQTPYEESHRLMERLYEFAGSLTDEKFQLAVYHVIIKYARQHGMQRFLAKGLLKKYLIERENLRQLDETFRDGEEISHYVDFLSHEERIVFFFRMALHAYNIKEYKQCIDYCSPGLQLESTNTELKARAYLAMINSHSRLGNYNAVEKHLDVFEKFEYDFVMDSVKMIRAFTKARKKEFDVAIPLIRSYLSELEKDNRIHLANELLEIYSQIGDEVSFSEIVNNEDEILPDNPQTPYKYRSIGRYYQQKGAFQLKKELIEEGMESYFKSLHSYGMVGALHEINEHLLIVLPLRALL